MRSRRGDRRRRVAGEPRARHAHRGPRHHHLVHGLHGHRRRPRAHAARARRRRGALGHRPESPRPGHRRDLAATRRTTTSSSTDSSRAGPTTTRPARTGSRCRRRRSRSSPATRSGTSDFGLTTGGPYSFTTPLPPPGRFLFSIVLCNDLHMGETTAGPGRRAPQIIGIQQEPGLPPYPEVMLESLVADATALGADYLLAAGDITAEAVPARPEHGRPAAQRLRRATATTTS